MGLFRNITKSIGRCAHCDPGNDRFWFWWWFDAALLASRGMGFFSKEACLLAVKLGLGVGALASQEAWVSVKNTVSSNAPILGGKDFDMTGRLRDGSIAQLNDPDQLKQYRKEIQTAPNPEDYDRQLNDPPVGIASMYHGGEVHDGDRHI